MVIKELCCFSCNSFVSLMFVKNPIFHLRAIVTLKSFPLLFVIKQIIQQETFLGSHQSHTDLPLTRAEWYIKCSDQQGNKLKNKRYTCLK